MRKKFETQVSRNRFILATTAYLVIVLVGVVAMNRDLGAYSFLVRNFFPVAPYVIFGGFLVWPLLFVYSPRLTLWSLGIILLDGFLGSLVDPYWMLGFALIIAPFWVVTVLLTYAVRLLVPWEEKWRGGGALIVGILTALVPAVTTLGLFYIIVR